MLAVGLLPIIGLATACDSERLPDPSSDGSVDVTIPPGGGEVIDPPIDPPADVPPTDPTQTDPPADDPPATDPPDVDPPSTDAPAIDPPGTEASSEGDGGVSTPLLIVLILLGVGVVVALVVAATRRRPAPTEDPRAHILSTARWIHDQLSLEILALPPADAQTRWSTERSRLDQLVIDLRSVAPSQRPSETWEQLAASVAVLSSSLDTAVRLRTSADADPALVRESVTIANSHRADLQRTLLVAEQSIR